MQSQAAQKDPAMSGQNKHERIADDLYQTTPDNIDCIASLIDLSDTRWWEPACGEGNISKRIEQITSFPVWSTDLRDRGYGIGDQDFLAGGCELPTFAGKPVTGIITNPPYEKVKGEKYSRAEQFVRKSLELMKPVKGKVIMFMRTEFDTAKGRKAIFENHPAYMMKVIVTKRPRWIVGSTGSPRHSYSFYVWDWAHDGTQATVHYIHPDDANPILAPAYLSSPNYL